MPKATAYANDLLKYFLQAAAPSYAGNANLYVALHTAPPGIGNSQNSNEASYTGYARQPVTRNSAGWTVSSNNVTNATPINFPINSGSAQTVTDFSIGVANSGATEIIYTAALATSKSIGTGANASFATGAISISES